MNIFFLLYSHKSPVRPAFWPNHPVYSFPRTWKVCTLSCTFTSPGLVLLSSLPIPSFRDPFEHCPLHQGEGQVWLAGECLLLLVLRACLLTFVLRGGWSSQTKESMFLASAGIMTSLLDLPQRWPPAWAMSGWANPSPLCDGYWWPRLLPCRADSRFTPGSALGLSGSSLGLCRTNVFEWMNLWKRPMGACLTIQLLLMKKTKLVALMVSPPYKNIK